MFKKYLLLILLTSFFSFVFIDKSYAIWQKYPSPGDFSTNVTYSGFVVSANDFNDSIQLQGVYSGEDTLTFKGDFDSTGTFSILGTGQVNTINPTTTIIVSHIWSTVGNHSLVSKVYNSENLPSGNATYNINLSYAPITLTASPSISEGQTIGPYTSETFTCTNSTEMYYDGTLVDSDYTGASLYNLSFTTIPTNGSHSVECDNIGGALTREILNFNVGAGMSGVISASNCSIEVGASSCSSTVSWNTYSPVSTSAVTSETDASGQSSPGNVIANADSGSMNVNIPYIVLGSHQGRNFYLYNNSIELANATALAECVSGSSWDGTKCAEPIDPDPEPTECLLPNYLINTPSGTICSQCSTGSDYDAINHTCILTSSIPYTHFLSFNASAGNIKKGTGIDFNWSIQKPDNSCKIVGVAIASGAIVFNSQDYSSINASVSGDGLSPNLSAGSYKSKIGSYFTVNQSTRFTASCITPEESYNPGYHQLVRDVYVIGEKER